MLHFLRGDIMQSVPIFEAKNKLPLLVHRVEQGDSFEITRHGKPVAYLVNKDEKKEANQVDKFEMVMNHWKEKYSNCFLSDEEEKEYFEKPRQKSSSRTFPDFEG